MGAAAFLMVEYVGISYVEVIKAAILPAAISYIALLYIVHLEACKANMSGLPRKYQPSMAQKLLSFIFTILLFLILSAAVYYGIGWTKTVFGVLATPMITVALLIAYVLLVKLAARYQDHLLEDPNQELTYVPDPLPTLKSGLYFLLPIVVLVWCLTVERFSLWLICVLGNHLYDLYFTNAKATIGSLYSRTNSFSSIRTRRPRSHC